MTSDIRIKIGLDGVPQVQAGAQQAATSLAKVGDAADLTSRQARLLSRNVGDALRSLGGGAGGALGEVASRVTQLGIAFGGLEGVAGRLAGGGPIAAVVAAVAAAGIAFKQGKAESDAYARALILSGNAAGATVGQLQMLAKAQSDVAGSQGKAADVLAQLAASGSVAVSEMAKATAAAVALERANGGAADATASKFVELGRAPLQALIKINEAENFLSKSVYETVKALEKQGRTAEAAAAAQNAYADAVTGRAAQLEPRLGYLEKAWRGLGDGAKWAWDKMLNLGREETVESRLAQVSAELERRRRAVGPNLSSRSNDLLSEQSVLQSDARTLRLGATVQRQQAEEVKAQIAADKTKASVGATRDAYADLTRELFNLEQAQEEELRTGGKLSEARKLQMRLVEQFVKATEKLTAAERVSTFGARQAIAAKIAQITVDGARNEAQQKAIKAEQEYAEAEAKAIQQQTEAIARQEEARRNMLAGLNERAQSIADEVRAAEIAASANITLAEAIEHVAIARLREKAAASAADPGRLKEINEEIAAREKLLSALAGKASRDAAEKSAQEFQQAYERSYNELSQGLTDALIEGGKSAADYLRGLFRTLVLRPLFEPLVRPIAGVLAGATGGASAFAATGADQSAFGQASQASSLFQAGKTIYDGFASGFAGAGAQAQSLYASVFGSGSTYSANAAAIEAQAGLSGYYGTGSGAAVGANGAGSASAFGTAASYAAGAAVGIYGGRAISGGYSAIGGSGNTAVNVGTAIGAIWGPIGAAVGGAIGGIVNRAFGRKAPEVTGRSIEGSITGADFTGATVTDILEKGGLFRSDKRYSQTQAITGDLDKALDEGARSLSALAAKYGAALGLPAEQLAGVTAQIKVKITDSADENAKAVADALQQYADALLGTFSADLEPLRQSGETVAQTIERVGGALLTVNDSLELLGAKALATSVDGGKAAVALSGLFGSADTFASAAGSFYQKFFTESERADKATQQLTKTLGEFGLAVPATREAYRDLVKRQLELGEAGYPAAAALLGLADTFDALRTAAGDTAQALADVIRERKDLETQLLEVQGNTVALRAQERAALDESNRALYDQIQALKDQKDAAEEAAKAAEELASRQRSVVSGADSIIGDFLKGPELASFYAKRIQETLAEGGIGSTIPGILGSTRADIMRLWNAVGTEGREAILAAYDAWKDLDEVLRGTARAVASYRSGTLADSIEQARLGSLAPAARLAELRRQEAAGFAGLGAAVDPVAAAQRLAGIVSQRVALESQADDARREALQNELELAERIRDTAQDALQAAALMKFDELSSLSARDQVAAARALFDRTVARARAGDQAALGNLVSTSQAFRQEASAAYASGPAYAAIDALVRNTLEQFGLAGAGAGARATELQQQIDALDAIDTSLGENGALYQALLRIDSTLAGAFAGTGAAAAVTGTVTMTGTNGVLTGISETGTSLSVQTPLTLPAVVDAASARTEALLQQVLAHLQLLVSRTEAGLTLEQADTRQLVDGLKAIETPLVDIARQTRLGNRESSAVRAT